LPAMNALLKCHDHFVMWCLCRLAPPPGSQ
jgi:hypothetical protein